MSEILSKIICRGFLFIQKGVACMSNMSLVSLGPEKAMGATIFLVGPPRSGSTLIMQVLSDAFNIGYFSNQHAAWFASPSAAEFFSRPLSKKRPSDYTSNYGRIRGRAAPSECSAWWYRFFRRSPAYVTLENVSERKMRAFRRSLARFGEAVGLPLVFKNLYTSLRLEPIARYLPEALYVVVDRNWVDNAQSILKGRKDRLGAYDRWWSVPPPNVMELEKLPPVQQVIGQIEAIHKLIDEDVNRLGLEDRILRVHYEDFCRDVHGALERFMAFTARHGVELERRFEVPERFEISRPVNIPQSMYEELVHEVALRQSSHEEEGAHEA